MSLKKPLLQEIERIKSTTGFSHEHLKMTTNSLFSHTMVKFHFLITQEVTFPDSFPKISFGKMTISENGKNHAHVNSCTPWINGRLTGTICRLLEIMNQ
jgi:hypothetical protein